MNDIYVSEQKNNRTLTLVTKLDSDIDRRDLPLMSELLIDRRYGHQRLLWIGQDPPKTRNLSAVILQGSGSAAKEKFSGASDAPLNL